MNKKYDSLSVTAFIKKRNKVLIAKRADSDRYLPGYWEQVGGKVEPGESLEEAVVREVKEEADIIVDPVCSYNRYRFTKRDGRRHEEVAFICKLVDAPDIRISLEHSAYKWIDGNELDKISPMSDYMRAVIKKGFVHGKL